MNSTFAEHVTNTAFFLSISKKQTAFLSVLYNTPWPSKGYYFRDMGGRSNPDSWYVSYHALVRKGLAKHTIDDPTRGYGHYELTEAGRLTCLLLIEAGLIIPVKQEASNEDSLHRMQG
jgi:hypothetical protein